MVAVIDGVTAQSERQFCGKAGGCFAKDQLLDCLKNQEKNLCKMDATEMYKRLNAALAEAVSENLSLEEYPRACVMIYNDYRHEISGYGDCTCMINGTLYDFTKEVDRINSENRALALESAIAKGSTIEELLAHDVGREAIEAGLKNRFVFENQAGPLGYPTLNGYSFNESMVFAKSVNDGDELIIATDGYPYVRSTLRESEEVLIQLIEKDPLCFREYKSTKGLQIGSVSFDDRTYWRGVV